VSAAPLPQIRLQAAAETADDGERLDRFLFRALAGRHEGGPLSRSRIKALIDEGHAQAAGATISDPSHRVKPGRVYELSVPAAIAAEPAGQAIPLTVVYEDADLIVVDKPAGMVVHPAPGAPDSTLVNALIAHCGASLSGIGGVRRPGIVHRIDKDTSGLLVAAKHDAAHAGLSRLFAAHDIERVYAAFCWGLPATPEGRIEGAIGRDPGNRKRMAVVSHGGRPALTFYRVVRGFGLAAAQLDVTLATGRTHQIRVHLTAQGHPLIGDPVYGRVSRARREALSPAAAAAVAGLGRQALHARVLGFRHPVSGRMLRFESELPSDLNGLAQALAAP
jgi:23S rRNA pseudouridine1911/1915/1917 synthase